LNRREINKLKSRYRRQRRGKTYFSFLTGNTLKRHENGVPEEMLFMSRKRSKGDFVLLRILWPDCFSIIRFLAIEGQLLQPELWYLQNRYDWIL
jgi:hypothetical protein